MSDFDDRRPDLPDSDDSVLDERAFDDPAHDELRRLLADARVTEPVPDAVAARLDATLASLRERSREESPAPTNVVPLRRRLGRVLVAAAVVVVIGGGGVGIAQLSSGGRSDTTSADSARSTDKSSAGSEASAPQAVAPTGAPGVGATGSRALPRLTTASFGRDVSRAMRTTYASLDTSALAGRTPQSDSPGQLGDLGQGYDAPAAPPVTTSPGPTAGDFLSRDAASCTGPEVPDAVTLPATLDGALVALVFRPPTTEDQLVEAWSCDGATLLATATVPY